MSFLIQKISHIGYSLHSSLLLLIRLFWGGSFFVTGIGKFQHMNKVVHYFESLGIPFAFANAALVATVETVCGACLVLGLFSRFASIPLMCVMVVAFMTAESEAVRMIFVDPQKFIHSTPFSFLFASLLIFVFGPGSYSMDHFLWTASAPSQKFLRSFRRKSR